MEKQRSRLSCVPAVQHVRWRLHRHKSEQMCILTSCVESSRAFAQCQILHPAVITNIKGQKEESPPPSVEVQGNAQPNVHLTFVPWRQLNDNLSRVSWKTRSRNSWTYDMIINVVDMEQNWIVVSVITTVSRLPVICATLTAVFRPYHAYSFGQSHNLTANAICLGWFDRLTWSLPSRLQPRTNLLYRCTTRACA